MAKNHIPSDQDWIRWNFLMRGKLVFLCKLPHFQEGKLQSSIKAGRERENKKNSARSVKL